MSEKIKLQFMAMGKHFDRILLILPMAWDKTIWCALHINIFPLRLDYLALWFISAQIKIKFSNLNMRFSFLKSEIQICECGWLWFEVCDFLWDLLTTEWVRLNYEIFIFLSGLVWWISIDWNSLLSSPGWQCWWTTSSQESVYNWCGWWRCIRVHLSERQQWLSQCRNI